jgi:GT2 family glycosyltransferase
VALELESLLAQGADQVRLHIPHTYRRFPDWDGTLPSVPAGVQVIRCDTDLGPATKILPAARDLRGQDAQILFCDDDCIVPPGWADRLFAIQARRPDQAVAVYVRPSYLPAARPPESCQAWQVPVAWDIPYRASRLMHKLFGTSVAFRRPFWIPGYGAVLFGVGGVVVRPEFFDDTAFDIPEIAWLVDDIWLSAMLARRGIRIYCPWRAALPKPQDSSTLDALLDTTFAGQDRQALNRAAAEFCRDRFGIWG